MNLFVHPKVSGLGLGMMHVESLVRKATGSISSSNLLKAWCLSVLLQDPGPLFSDVSVWVLDLCLSWMLWNDSDMPQSFFCGGELLAPLPCPALYPSSSQLPLCWLRVVVAAFAGEGRLTSHAFMLPHPPKFSSTLAISLCCESQVPCSSCRLQIIKVCLWH